jgi:large subunit ribosomal protein L17
MRHRKKKVTLDRPSGQRKALLKNLVKSFVVHGKIRTTEAKAKATRSIVERLITIGKVPTLASRRLLIQRTGSAAVAEKIIKSISPRCKDRKGGYTRTVKLGARHGDGAHEVLLTLVDV